MKIKYITFWFLLSSGAITNACFAAEQPVQQFKAFIAKVNTLVADVKQVSIDQHGRPTQTSYGLFYLQRPGKFRWNYHKPFVQQIVGNSDKVWFYDADLQQVTIKKIDQSLGSTPALLLSGKISLEENFVIQNQGMNEGLQWIKLLPKKEGGGFNYILIGMKDGKLGGMELNDNFGQLTRIYFTNLKLNGVIKPEIFEFKAPEGVDVFAD
jgi:outer membrane lipoprotein carrier protein